MGRYRVVWVAGVLCALAGVVEAQTMSGPSDAADSAEGARALDLAVSEIESAAERTGQVLDDATAAALGGARWLAGRLGGAAEAIPDDVRQAGEGFVAALDSLADCLRVGTVASPLGPAGPRVPRADTDPRCR